ncbi:uncharacterized protein EI97DRAFT_426739 [Westerdykella ornata]|uniref:PXA domain-containing protein n=1 Tax=Westerdykella ornata TaxID=318751 RepID=A0A6A6J9A9_WESOR|nr:uncharacterized protein EI97DRAFT_426739 [Westerdykella ornata]KAF2272226.1 hypothetical protein EI97DRAFT_426739 [Westerdykella ornata]
MSEPIQTCPSAPDEPPPDTPPASTSKVAREDSKDEQENPFAPTLDLKSLTDRTLRFLATASNETLGACLVGLGAGTYIVLGRVGLILIGVVGGVVLHATWEGSLAVKDGERVPKELRVDVARRLLDWRGRDTSEKKAVDNEDVQVDLKLLTGRELDYSDFRPETAAALTDLTDAVIRDYVKWWYSPILPSEPTFPAECRQTLTAFMISVSSHLSRKRPADSFVDFVTRSSSFMIIIFQELSVALAASPSASVAEAVDGYLEMNPECTLGNILDNKYQQKQFDMAADDILQSYLDPKTYNCKPAQVFLRQILAKVVLEKIVVSCSKPEWINSWIVYLLEEGEPELMHAIDAGVEESSGQLQNVKSAVDKEEKLAEEAATSEQIRRNRAVSKAQEAMDEAMREAQRLSQMIADEEARKLKEQECALTASLHDDKSESTTQGVVTPTSSQSETLGYSDAADLGISNVPAQTPSQINASSPTKAEDSPKQEAKRAFTSFDQIVPNQPPTALMANPPPPLTLHNCKISIFDDSVPGEKGNIKSKPTAEYLIQIEPASNHYSGWMTVRKYTDLETLHEVLRRIANITGTFGFTEAHSTLPVWKGHTKSSLRGELERYLNDAVKYKPLAESEGMKRFLEKESQVSKSPGKGFPGIGWPGQTFETMGKGMIDVLTKAPKEVAGGGKALLGGVTGVLNSVATPLGGARRNRESVPTDIGTVNRATTAPSPSAQQPIQNRHGRAESTVSELPTHIRTESIMSSFSRRTSTDSLRVPNSPIIDQQPQREAPMERRPSLNPDGDGKRSNRSSVYGSRNNSRAPSVRASMDLSPVMGGDQLLNLPPMPSDIPDDYVGNEPQPALKMSSSTTSLLFQNASDIPPPLPRRTSATSLTSPSSLNRSHPQPSRTFPTHSSHKSAPKQRKPHAPLTTQETTVLIELFFALTQELYTLSSAWQIRLTLLSAAKSFLLRPGNPQLASIQQLLQSTVLDANTSDSAIASYIQKVRQNALPTEDELKAWPAEMDEAEKTKLREKARRLLVERGMPMALTSVMGQAASGEALGRVFDALQVEKVARGFMFGLVVQGLRGLTQ